MIYKFILVSIVMSTEEEITQIAHEYLKKSGISDFQIINVEDAIYKWRVHAEGPDEKYLIEISKSQETVIKYEIL